MLGTLSSVIEKTQCGILEQYICVQINKSIIICRLIAVIFLVTKILRTLENQCLWFARMVSTKFKIFMNVFLLIKFIN